MSGRRTLWSRVGPNDDRVGDLEDLVGRHLNPTGVLADGLRAGCLVDADGPEGAAGLGDHVTADPANVVGEAVHSDLFGSRRRRLELIRARPCLFPADRVGLHAPPLLGVPVCGSYRLTVGIYTAPVAVEAENGAGKTPAKGPGRPSEGAR